MTLPLETINGKQYRPIEVKSNMGKCMGCDLNDFMCKHQSKCDPLYRADRLEVLFLEPGDTNKQEKIKQES